MGQLVRFDGGHQRSSYIVDNLQQHFEFLQVCPEMGMGMGTPRPAIQLRRDGDKVRLVSSKNIDVDYTDAMDDFCEATLDGLSHVDGYIFKKGSPSCGVERVPIVVSDNGSRCKEGIGMFARAFMKKYPLIPVEEDGRLNDARLRENFFERVYAYQRWKNIPNPETNVKGFIEYHASHKFMLMARGSSYYQELGRLASGTTKNNLKEKRQIYIHRFMEVMAMRPPNGRHVNVLMHIMGFLKSKLESSDKRELLEVFESYRKRQVPLVTPVTLLRHHLRHHPHPYIQKQYYMNPYPDSMSLRSSI